MGQILSILWEILSILLEICYLIGIFRNHSFPPSPSTTILESFSGKFFLTTRAQSEKVEQISFRPPNFFLPVRPWLFRIKKPGFLRPCWTKQTFLLLARRFLTERYKKNKTVNTPPANELNQSKTVVVCSKLRRQCFEQNLFVLNLLITKAFTSLETSKFYISDSSNTTLNSLL
jgi:hypothetical protein